MVKNNRIYISYKLADYPDKNKFLQKMEELRLVLKEKGYLLSYYEPDTTYSAEDLLIADKVIFFCKPEANFNTPYSIMLDRGQDTELTAKIKDKHVFYDSSLFLDLNIENVLNKLNTIFTYVSKEIIKVKGREVRGYRNVSKIYLIKHKTCLAQVLPSLNKTGKSFNINIKKQLLLIS